MTAAPTVCYNRSMRSPSFIAAPLLLAMLALPASAAPKKPAPAPVSVTRLTWHGWDGAVRLSNGVVEAIVVPSIGRIMDFRLAGRPETSPVFVNPDWEGKSVADADPTTWAAFGGDKLWPSPQSEWDKHNARAWPPDQTFDGDPEVAALLPDGVKLTTPDSLAFAARATRTITLKPGEARLYVAQTLIKDPDASGPRDGFPLGVWSITQTRGDGTLFLPVGAGAAFPGGFVSLGDAGDVPAAPDFTRAGGLLRITRDRAKSHKIGTASAAGWAASLYGGDVLFSEHYTYRPWRALPGRRRVRRGLHECRRDRLHRDGAARATGPALARRQDRARHLLAAPAPAARAEGRGGRGEAGGGGDGSSYPRRKRRPFPQREGWVNGDQGAVSWGLAGGGGLLGGPIGQPVQEAAQPQGRPRPTI